MDGRKINYNGGQKVYDETLVKSAIAIETDRAEGVESDLQTQLTTEVNTARSKESDITANINAETIRAKSIEESLQTQINQKATGADILNAVTTEAGNRIYADNKLEKEIATKADKYDLDIMEAYIKSKADPTAISDIDAIIDAVATERTRALGVEADLEAANEANATAISDEITRAKAAETINATDIAAEIERATLEEQSNAENITAVENDLNSKITTEVTRATTVEETITKQLIYDKVISTDAELKEWLEYSGGDIHTVCIKPGSYVYEADNVGSITSMTDKGTILVDGAGATVTFKLKLEAPDINLDITKNTYGYIARDSATLLQSIFTPIPRYNYEINDSNVVDLYNSMASSGSKSPTYVINNLNVTVEITGFTYKVVSIIDPDEGTTADNYIRPDLTVFVGAVLNNVNCYVHTVATADTKENYALPDESKAYLTDNYLLLISCFKNTSIMYESSDSNALYYKTIVNNGSVCCYIYTYDKYSASRNDELYVDCSASLMNNVDVLGAYAITDKNTSSLFKPKSMIAQNMNGGKAFTEFDPRKFTGDNSVESLEALFDTKVFAFWFDYLLDNCTDVTINLTAVEKEEIYYYLNNIFAIITDYDYGVKFTLSSLMLNCKNCTVEVNKWNDSTKGVDITCLIKESDNCNILLLPDGIKSDPEIVDSNRCTFYSSSAASTTTHIIENSTFCSVTCKSATAAEADRISNSFGCTVNVSS